jgi:hypothetical protein
MGRAGHVRVVEFRARPHVDDDRRRTGRHARLEFFGMHGTARS